MEKKQSERRRIKVFLGHFIGRRSHIKANTLTYHSVLVFVLKICLKIIKTNPKTNIKFLSKHVSWGYISGEFKSSYSIGGFFTFNI